MNKKSERFADTIQAYLFADTNSDLGNRLRESVLLYFLNSPTSGISHVLASSYLSSFTGGDGSGAVMAVRNLLSHEVLSSNQDGCISSMQLYASVGLILHLHQQADQFDQNNKARIVELLSGQRANLPLSPLLQRTFVKVLQGVVCNSPARTRVPVHSIFTSVVQYCQHQANSSFEDKMDLVIALLDLILLNSALLNSRTQGDRVIHSPQALWRFVIAPAVSSLWASMEQYHGKDAEIISDFLIDYSFARLTNLVFLNIWCHKQDSVEERVGTILKQVSE